MGKDSHHSEFIKGEPHEDTFLEKLMTGKIGDLGTCCSVQKAAKGSMQRAKPASGPDDDTPRPFSKPKGSKMSSPKDEQESSPRGGHRKSDEKDDLCQSQLEKVYGCLGCDLHHGKGRKEHGEGKKISQKVSKKGSDDGSNS